ncbi:MAG: DinB family protein, partial [Acidobacteriota bacterium]|nr:DinB family protein [Acidobacteriota bacterium]
MSDSMARSLIADMKQEGELSRAVLAAVPEDRFDWQPHAKSMSLGALASHIAETPTWLGSMMEDVFDFGTGMEDYKPFAAADKAELLAALDENLAAAIALLENKDD